jgi:hypothetical protein
MTERLYHGTRAELRPGDPVGVSGTYVYLTPILDEAIWDAELADGESPGRVYIVEPTGEVGVASERTGGKPAGHPSMSLCSREPLRVVGEVTEWPLYHGTRAALEKGDLLEPGHRSNFGDRPTAKGWIYFSRTLDAATWGAELAAGDGPGRIYVVEPTGPIENDPDLTDRKFRGNPTKSFRSREPLRVTGEITNWKGHSSEAVEGMKAFLKRLGEQNAGPMERSEE